MVMYDNANILKQQKILNILLHNDNKSFTNEYEAQKLISIVISKTLEEYNLNDISVSSLVKKTNLIKWKNGRSETDYFVKMFFNEIKYCKETYGVTNSEVSFLYDLFEYLAWETNLLIDEEGNPINQKHLIELTGMTKNTISNYMKSLESKKCLIRIWYNKSTYYIINPYLAFKGTKIDKEIPQLFDILGYVSARNAKINKKKNR